MLNAQGPFRINLRENLGFDMDGKRYGKSNAERAKGYMQKKGEESSFQTWLKEKFMGMAKKAKKKGQKGEKDAPDKKR
jgi:hypothetical protein